MLLLIKPTSRSNILRRFTISRQNSTRTKILKSASDMIARSGYDTTSVAEICQEANVSKGAFYHHFPSKQSLFICLMNEWLQFIDVGFNQIEKNSGNVPEALLQMAGMTGHIFEAANSGFPIIIEFWRQAMTEPEVWKEAVKPYNNYLEFFEKMITQGIAQGSLDSTVDPKIASRLLLAMAMGYLLQASFDPQGTSWSEVTQSGMQIIINGMRRIE